MIIGSRKSRYPPSAATGILFLLCIGLFTGVQVFHDIINAFHVRSLFCNYAFRGYPMYAYSHYRVEDTIPMIMAFVKSDNTLSQHSQLSSYHCSVPNLLRVLEHLDDRRPAQSLSPTSNTAASHETYTG